MSQLIYKKMSDVMKDIGSIGKDQKNQAQGFKFRGIDQFVNALHPALNRHGVFMTPRATRFDQEVKDVTRSNGKAGVDKHVSLMMEYDFYAEDGSKVTVGPIPAEGLDSGDKATNKALSAALKYALIQTFSIPTEDMAEADLETPEMGKANVVLSSRPAPLPVSSSGRNPQEIQTGTPPNPGNLTSADQTTAAMNVAVEPMKRSSFRKPGRPVAQTEKVDTGEQTGEWN